MWADEEEKKFYEDLVELRGKVPNALLGVADDEKGLDVDGAKDEEVKEASAEENGEAAARIDDDDAAEEPECVSPARSRSAELTVCANREDPVAKLESAEPDPSIPSGPAAQLNAIFARLPEASSKKSIDDIAVEFAFLNSKAARKRLVKVAPSHSGQVYAYTDLPVLQTLGSVSRNRQDILPYYSRLVGTLNPYMPDVGKELVALVRG